MLADDSRKLFVSSEVWTSWSPLLDPAGACQIRIFDNYVLCSQVLNVTSNIIFQLEQR